MAVEMGREWFLVVISFIYTFVARAGGGPAPRGSINFGTWELVLTM